MYVCICKGITDGDIREAAAGGACTLKDLRRELGVAMDCGKCATCAHAVLRECREHQTTAQVPAASLQAA